MSQAEIPEPQAPLPLSGERAAAAYPPATDIVETAGAAARRELEATALHEAGHVVFALAMGINVQSATIERRGSTLGHVTCDPLPVPAQAMCQPGSAWIDLEVKTSLAGDRAARVIAPFQETATGGPASDYAQATRYLDAVYVSTEIESQLDRLCFELDTFFRAPQISELVNAVAETLMNHRTGDGTDLRRLVCGGPDTCGAFHPDFQIRCTKRPHHVFGFHLGRNHENQLTSWRLVDWTDDRTPHYRRSAAWKRVVRIHSPELLPPPPRKQSFADVPQLLTDAKNPALSQREQEAALRKVAKLLSARRREASVSHSLPRPSDKTDRSEWEMRERHQEECGEELLSTDGGYWCEYCAFELSADSSSRRRRHWLYLVLEYRQVRQVLADGTLGEPEWTAAPGASFGNAEEARNYLRITRATRSDLPPMRVRRIARL